MWNRLMMAGALFALSGCCCGLGGRPLTEEERAAQEERRRATEAERQAAIAGAPARAQRFAQVAALIDPHAEVARTPCPEAELAAAEPSILRMDLPTVDYGRLIGATVASPAEWSWLNDDHVTLLEQVRTNPTGASESQLEQVGRSDKRYLAVFVTEVRQLPAVTRQEGIIRQGQWEGGVFIGGIHIVDLDGPRIVCSVPMEAESSDSVTFDDRGLLRTTFEEAILEDFQEQMEDAADDAVESITAHASINLVGLL